MTHHAVSAVATVLILLLSSLATVPYAQQTANSHMNAGPFLAIVYATLGVIAAVVVLLDVRRRWSYAIPAATTLLFAWWLLELVCEKCAAGG